MSYIDWIRDTIEGSIDGIESNLSWIDSNGPGVIRFVIESTPIYWPPPMRPLAEALITMYVRELHEGVKLVREALENFRSMVQSIGSPDALRQAATNWRNLVGRVLDEMAPMIDISLLRTGLTNNWDGSAAAAYRNSFAGQQNAAGRVKDSTDKIGTALEGSAAAIEAFGIALVGAVFALAGSVIATVATLAGGVSAPIAVLTIIAGVLEVGGAILMGLAAYNLMTSTQVSLVSAVQTQGSLKTWPDPVFS
jgi:hypothetical protein